MPEVELLEVEQWAGPISSSPPLSGFVGAIQEQHPASCLNSHQWQKGEEEDLVSHKQDSLDSFVALSCELFHTVDLQAVSFQMGVWHSHVVGQ